MARTTTTRNSTRPKQTPRPATTTDTILLRISGRSDQEADVRTEVKILVAIYGDRVVRADVEQGRDGDWLAYIEVRAASSAES